MNNDLTPDEFVSDQAYQFVQRFNFLAKMDTKGKFITKTLATGQITKEAFPSEKSITVEIHVSKTMLMITAYSSYCIGKVQRWSLFHDNRELLAQFLEKNTNAILPQKKQP